MKKCLKLFAMLTMGMIMLVGMSGISYAEDTASVFNKAYIPSYGSGYIDVYDLTSDTMELKKIQVGSGPVTGVISPTGAQVFVSNMNSNSVSIIDPTTYTVVKTLDSGFSQPFGIAFNESGSKAYVANYASSVLTVIDTTTWEQSTITVGVNMGTVETVANYVYVAGWNTGAVYKIDMTTNSVVETLNVGASTHGMTSNLDGTKLYLGCTDGYMKVIDLDTFTIGTGANVGSSIAGVEITPDGTRIFVSSISSNTCYSINANDFSDITESTVGTSNYGLGIQGDYAYVLAMGSHKMYKINLETNTVVSEVATSQSPVAMGRFMVSTRVYSEVGGDTASDDATLSSLSLSSGSLNSTFDSSTETYTASVANGVSSLTVTPTVNDSNATVTVRGSSVISGSESGSIDLDVGENTINVVVTAENASTKTYTITVTRLPNTTAPNLTAGAVSRISDTEGTVKFTSDEAGSYFYAVVADGAAAPDIDTTGDGTVCTTSETTITNPSGLTAGAKDIYIQVKNAAGNVSTALKIDIAGYTPEDKPRKSKSKEVDRPVQETVAVIINGEEQNAGTETTTTEEGKSTVTVELKNEVIESKINETIKNSTSGADNIIQVSIADTKSEAAKVELTGGIVKKLEENTFDVSVKRENVEYVIPAEEFAISKVAENLGVSESELDEIKVEVKITKLDETVVEKYNQVAKTNGAELIFPPVEFEIVAKTTKTDGTEKKQPISKFRNYVERVMEIPAGVDPNKITTGIVFHADGAYRHVPTTIYQKDGKWYARLNSLTNSNYSVIWNPVTVKSVENHWAKEAVNNLASRLIIFNPESFEPNKAITRADFAEYIIRALGLYKEGSAYENKFKDVSAAGDRTLAVLIASKYGIVTGYTDGTFKPDTLITREEAMAMYQRAMKITNLTGSDTTRYQNYTDYAKVGSWAKEYVKEVLSAHVFNGTSATTISPKSNLTYAEAAQAISNLLVESNLINK